MANPNTPIYPTGIATDNNLPVATDSAFSPLASTINNSVTSIPFVTNSVFTLPCLIALENEIVLAEGPIVGINITNCQRGFIGSAASHNGGIVGYGYIFSYIVNQLSAEIKAIETALGVSLGNVISTGASVGGDLSGTLPNPTVATVGGASASNIADAVTKRHAQNTDTGTSSATFQLGTGGVKLKNTGTGALVRNAGDSAYADLDVENLNIHGVIGGSPAAGGDLTGSYPNPTLTTTGVGAGTYGDGTHVPVFIVDAKGRLSSVTNTAITGAPASGTAGGDLTGSYPNPTLTATGVGAGIYGDATHVPVFTVDSKGRISLVTNTLITFGTAGGDLSGSYPNPTVATVGSLAAASVASGATAANNATPNATALKIVARDANADFAARNITARIIGGNSSPTRTNGTGAGTGPTTSITGTDMAGIISVTTGSGPASASAIMTVAFGVNLASAPSAVVLEPANAAAAALTTANVFVTSLATTGFVVESNAVSLAATTTYQWYYIVIG
jgi:hypothetical protein